ncbi:uncharacterized protein LOC133917815 [Phragmites australis]|uniref:uncharacterized protein LOC133917815 n=1 Tax=Phragmites australis TaxID=29695 RepID=UPI002D766C81|nr:uncharacterized protein LOC133917815 [Phragmites australis]
MVPASPPVSYTERAPYLSPRPLRLQPAPRRHQLAPKQSQPSDAEAEPQDQTKQISWGSGKMKGEGSSAMEDRGQGPAENLPESPAVEDEDDGFSFPVPPLAADACIVPVYPIFGRPPSQPPLGEDEPEPETATVRVPLGRLLLEDREFWERHKDGRSATTRARQEEHDEASAGGDEELEGVPPESYCRWAPGGQSAPASPRRCGKSGSTGSVLRWRRISERLVGRSHSDGKEKFVFLTAPGAKLPPNKEEEEGAGSSKGHADGVGHRWSYYGRGGGGGGGGRRRSYLPYKQDLVGLFANVSGLRRSYHPF